LLDNFEEIFKDLEIREEEKKKLIAVIKEEFPQDEMFFELHLFRTSNF